MRRRGNAFGPELAQRHSEAVALVERAISAVVSEHAMRARELEMLRAGLATQHSAPQAPARAHQMGGAAGGRGTQRLESAEVGDLKRDRICVAHVKHQLFANAPPCPGGTSCANTHALPPQSLAAKYGIHRRM